MEVFQCPMKILSGTGAVSALREWRPRRLFLVTEPAAEEGGTAERIAIASGAESRECLGRPARLPTAEDVAETAAAIRGFQPDLVAVLGNRETLELGRTAAFLAKTGAVLVTIPTVPGSGAEVGDRVTVLHGEQRRILKAPELRGDGVILDDELFRGISPELAGEGGFTLLANAMEAWTAAGAGVMTDTLAREAFCMAYGALPAAYAGKQEVLLRLGQASVMAGIAACQAGQGLCSAMVSTLEAIYRVPQGKLCAVLLPAVLDVNAHVAGKKYGNLARAAGIGGSTNSLAVQNLRGALLRLRKEMGLPETLTEAGIRPWEIWDRTGEIVEQTLANPRCRENPMVPEDFLIRRILEEVTGRI